VFVVAMMEKGSEVLPLTTTPKSLQWVWVSQQQFDTPINFAIIFIVLAIR
jgi:hypothetical protein